MKSPDAGVEIWGCGTTCEFHSPDPMVVQRQIETCKRFVDLVSNEDDTDASHGKVMDELVDTPFGSDVDPDRGRIKNEYLGLRSQPGTE